MNAPHSNSASSVLDAYPIRIMLSLAASLSLLLALVHLPVQSSTDRVGWAAHSSNDQILLSDIDTERSSDESPSETSEQAPPPTKLQFPRADAEPTSASSEQESDGSSSDDPEESPALKEAKSVATLGTSDRRPQIVGGKGSLYLNINYPQQAQRQGVEGQLELEFVVGTDGTVSDIEIAESLHPLCDSAAVRGLRSVEFIPAKYNGEPIPVRMELPVRFELKAVSTSMRTNEQDR